MELHRLRLLAELARLGSMRAVAEQLHVTTSTVSQQLAVLGKEAGATLIEPDGRRVRLTPAGRRLAAHAVTILAAVDAARLDLDPQAEPSGTVRVAAFASAISRCLLPVAAAMATEHPRLRLLLHEHEPPEAFALLANDEVDLALTYDYNVAPAPPPPTVEASYVWSTTWALGVPAAQAAAGPAPELFAQFRHWPWIVNSRNTADELAVRTIASMAGFEPDIAHRVDSLSLVQELILAGLGVGLLPENEAVHPGVRLLPVREPDVILRAYTVIRRGRAGWAPLALIRERISPQETVENGRSTKGRRASRPIIEMP